MVRSLSELFNVKKPIIGMIHLAGRDWKEKISQALEEIAIFEEEGLAGAIVEDYHGSVEDVTNVLKKVSRKKMKLVIGVNVLRNPYLGFNLAEEFGARFVQFDSVQTRDLDLNYYDRLREQYSNIFVLGGIRFKYKRMTGNSLEEDLVEGMPKCEAIVTTGEGTGIETPIEKLREFRRIMGDFPLIVGAGVNLKNIYEQLHVTDGAIVGSFFKGYDTNGKVIRERVNALMSKIKNKF
jgi:predicted TIM-barrel enzyme